jgi:hypothetical protein
VEIRTAQDGDLEAVVDQWARAGGPTSLPGGLPEAQALVQQDARALVIARVDARLAGTVIIGWDGWR